MSISITPYDAGESAMSSSRFVRKKSFIISMTSYYQLSLDKQSWYAIVVKEGTQQWDITIGGKQKGCVWITVHGKNARLERAAYDAQCNADGNMGAGERGTVPMIRAAISFVFQRFPNVQGITFQDHSHVDCNGTEVALAPLSLTEHKQTWYQRHFAAQLVRKETYGPYIQSFIEHVGLSQEWSEFAKDVQSITSIAEWKRIGPLLHQRWPSENGSPRAVIVKLKREKRCDIFVEWLWAYFNLITQGRVPLTNLDWIVQKNDVAPFDHPTTLNVKELDSSPYGKSLLTRRRNLSMSSCMSFVPRKQKGGQQLTWDDID